MTMNGLVIIAVIIFISAIVIGLILFMSLRPKGRKDIFDDYVDKVHQDHLWKGDRT